MNKQDTTTKITLEEIARQKEEVLLAIREQKSLIVKTARKSFEPYSEAASIGSSLLKSFNTGMAIIEGAMLGIKIMKRIRRFFR